MKTGQDWRCAVGLRLWNPELWGVKGSYRELNGVKNILAGVIGRADSENEKRAARAHAVA